MSLYNLLHGHNDHTALLAHILDLDVVNNGSGMRVGRFRDIELNADGTQIQLLTRNGGGNREHWTSEDELDPSIECRCPGCIQTFLLPTHPQYVSDRDDDFDSTFAITTFKVPEQWLETTTALATGKEPQTLSQKTQEACDVFAAMSPEQLRNDARTGPIVKQLEDALEGKT